MFETPDEERAQIVDVQSDSAAQPRHYHLKLDYGKPTERIVSFASQAERLRFLRECEGSWGEPYEEAMLRD